MSERTFLEKDKNGVMSIKYDMDTVRSVDKWKFKYNEKKDIPSAPIEETKAVEPNPYIDAVSQDILPGKAKEWLDEELQRYDVVMLFFFTDPLLNDEANTKHFDILQKLIEYDQYIAFNKKKLNSVVYGITTGMSQQRLTEIGEEIEQKHGALDAKLIRNTTCELGYRHGLNCVGSTLDNTLDNKLIESGICVFTKKTDFKTGSSEKYSYPQMIYQIRTIDPKSEKYRTKEIIDADETKYKAKEFQLLHPTPKDYSLVYGNPLDDFKNKHFTPVTGILNKLLNKENFYRTIKMIIDRDEEDKLFSNKMDKYKGCAVKRLMRDYKEIYQNPIEGVVATPIGDSNIFEWHVNIKGPDDCWYYKDTVIHLEITFGPLYPLRPPEIVVKTSIPHPNIFGEYICLDLLSDYYDESTNSASSAYNVKYGWSTAYSLYSILITLQAFINDGLHRKIYGPDKKDERSIEYHNRWIDERIRHIQKRRCTCGHTSQTPYPSFNHGIESKEDIPELVMDDQLNTTGIKPDENKLAIQKPTQDEVKHDETNPFQGYKFDRSKVKIVVPAPKPDPRTQSIKSNKYNYLIGKTIECEVSNVMQFGAFIDIGTYVANQTTNKQKNTTHGFGQRSASFVRDISCLIPTGEYVLNQIPKKGQMVKVKITGIDTKKPKVENPRYAGVTKFVGSMKAVQQEQQIIKIDTSDPIAEDQKRIVLKITKIFDHDDSMGKQSDEVQNLGIVAEDVKRCVRCFIRYDDIVESLRPYMFFQLTDVVQIGDTMTVDILGRGMVKECGDTKIFIGKPVNVQIPERMRRCSVRPFNLNIAASDQSSDLPNELSELSARHESNLVCFHSRASYKEDTLGIGVTVEYYDSGDISMIHPVCLDLISYDSFYNYEIKMSAWKNKFTHWIPLYLSKEHAKNLELHEKFISLLCQNKTAHKAKSLEHLPFSYHMVMKVLPVLMNTFVVIFMKGEIHESINALSAYTQIYRLLIAFCEKYPAIRFEADSRIYNFIRDSNSRIKKVIPSLGEIIPLLGISSFTWNDMSAHLLAEVFDRNVKWMLLQYPELGRMNELRETNISKIFKIADPNNPEEIERLLVKRRRMWTTMYQSLGADEFKKYKQDIDDLQARLIRVEDPTKVDPDAEEKDLVKRDGTEDRCIVWTEIDRGRFPKTFKANQVSLKLVMFHVYFLHSFRPIGVDAGTRLYHISKFLDTSFGRASQQIEDDFQKRVKMIKDVNTFKEFFAMIDIPKPSNPYLLRWMRQSVLNSLAKRYHIAMSPAKKIKKDPNEMNKKQALPSLNTEDLDY